MYLIIGSELAQLIIQLFKMLGSLELEHLALDSVVLSDLVPVFLVFLAVVDGHRDRFADLTSDPVK